MNLLIIPKLDNVLIMASEVGVYDVEPKNVLLKVRKKIRFS